MIVPAAAAKKAKSSGASIDDIMNTIKGMTVLELSELVKVLEDRFGVTAAAPMAMMPGVMPGAGAAEEADDGAPRNPQSGD